MGRVDQLPCIVIVRNRFHARGTLDVQCSLMKAESPNLSLVAGMP